LRVYASIFDLRIRKTDKKVDLGKFLGTRATERDFRHNQPPPPRRRS
jgi:hypothetical protein